MQETHPPINITLRDPDGLDAEPNDVALAAAGDLEAALRALGRYARRVDVHTTNTLMDEALNSGLDAGKSVESYAEQSSEVNHVRRASAFIEGARVHLSALADELS